MNVQPARGWWLVDFTESVIDAAQSWVCRNLDTAQALNDYFDRLTVSRRGVGLPISTIAEPIRNFGRYLYQCPASGGPYPPVGSSPPPFTGGQCAGTQYSYDATWTANNQPESSSQDFAALGPVVGLEVENLGATKNLVLVANGGLQRTVLRGIGSQFELTPGTLTLRPPTNGPDDCGDPPTDPLPPPDITYDAPDGTATTEPVTITIGDPVLQPDGDIIIPVSVAGPNWEVRVDLPATGEPRVVPPDTPVGDAPCNPEELPDADVPPGDEPEPPGGDRDIVGVFVVCDDDPEDINFPTQVVTTGNPTLFFPDLGQVLFVVQKGNSTAYLNPQRVQTRRAYVPVPSSQTAVGVQAVPRLGVNLQLFPVYARIASDEDESM